MNDKPRPQRSQAKPRNTRSNPARHFLSAAGWKQLNAARSTRLLDERRETIAALATRAMESAKKSPLRTLRVRQPDLSDRSNSCFRRVAEKAQRERYGTSRMVTAFLPAAVGHLSLLPRRGIQFWHAQP